MFGRQRKQTTPEKRLERARLFQEGEQAKADRLEAEYGAACQRYGEAWKAYSELQQKPNRTAQEDLELETRRRVLREAERDRNHTRAAWRNAQHQVSAAGVQVAHAKEDLERAAA